MALQTKNFSIRPGATKALQFIWYTVNPVTKVKTPVDLSTASAKMQIRAEEGAVTALMTLTSGVGITLTSGGEVFVLMEAVNTASYNTKKAVYDILITKDGIVTEFISGIVFLDQGVTT